MAALVDHFKGLEDGLCCKLLSSPNKPPPILPLISASVAMWKEIPRQHLALGKILDEGSFGRVYKGTWKMESGDVMDVAVKQLKVETQTNRNIFIREAKVMKTLHHCQMVRFFEVTTSSKPFLIITEFVKDGSLESYLHKRDAENWRLNENDCITVITQIADGMRYLHSKRVAHNDLAIRNVLIDHNDGLIVKISDFGVAKFVKKKIDSSFPNAKDVYDFGWLICEMAMHGRHVEKRGLEPNEIANAILINTPISWKEATKGRLCSLVVDCMKCDVKTGPSFDTVYTTLTSKGEADEEGEKRAR